MVSLKRVTNRSKNVLALLNNPNKYPLFLKEYIFKSHNRHNFSAKRDRLTSSISGSQLRLLIMRLSHQTTKKQHAHAEAKNSQTCLLHRFVEDNLTIKCYLQEQQIIFGFSSEHQGVFLIKGLLRKINKKKPKN